MLRTPTSPGFSAIGWLCVIALLLLLQQLFVALISERFFYEADIARAPVLLFVLSQVAAGFVFLTLLRIISRLELSTRIFVLTFLVGLLLRLFLFGSQPILEVDFYRYLWDGAVTANGFNPYLLAPDMSTHAGSAELQRLAFDAGDKLSRINYADLRTIYPPMTQLLFAATYLLDSYDLDTWRSLLLIFDIASFAIILQLLKQTRRSTHWSLIYWWNPSLIHETYNTLHMDVLVLPFLLMAMLLIINKRFIVASAMLTLAAGFKLWPLLLLPFAIRPLLSRPREFIIALATVASIGFIVVGPLFFYGLGENSGLLGYSTSWLRNSALFPLLDATLSSLAINSRLFIAIILGLLALFLSREMPLSPDQLLIRVCWLVVILFLLSPTQFPWYTIWFTAFLCFYPQPALLLLVALLPIYYLRFYFDAQGNVEVFDRFIIWLQYLPVYGLLAWTHLRRMPTNWRVNHV